MTEPRVEIERAVMHRCPFRDEMDYGQLNASWDGDAIELHDLGHYLDTFIAQALTHEQMAVTIAAELAQRGGANPEVRLRFRTAGMDVTVYAEHFEEP